MHMYTMIHDQKFYYVIKEGIPLSQMTWSIINNTAVYVGSLGMGALQRRLATHHDTSCARDKISIPA